MSDNDFLIYPVETGNDPVCAGWGAQMIVATSACLAGKRKSDLGRVGGEEFAVLLPETSLSRAKIVAERIRKQIASHHVNVNGMDLHLTASIGVAEASVRMSGMEALLNAGVLPAPAKIAAEKQRLDRAAVGGSLIWHSNRAALSGKKGTFFSLKN